MVREVSTTEEFNSVILDENNEHGKKYVFVDFYAQWCGPCKAIVPKLDEFSEKYGDNVYFIKVDIDVDELSETVDNLGIAAVPTFHVFKVGDLESYKNYETIKGANPAKIQETLLDLNETETDSENDSETGSYHEIEINEPENNVREVSSTEEFNNVILDQNNEHGKKYVFVDFYAQWCGPCKAISPLLNQYSQTYGDNVLFIKVDIDVDELSETVDEMGISAVPTFHIFQTGDLDSYKNFETIKGANPQKIQDRLRFLQEEPKIANDF